jgi:hypothetical protein
MVVENEDYINNFTIKPFSVEQGAGFGGSQWTYEWTDNGSFSYTSLAVGALAGLVASIFTGGIVVPAIAGVVSAFVSALSSERGGIYYTWKHTLNPIGDGQLYTKSIKMKYGSTKILTAIN